MAINAASTGQTRPAAAPSPRAALIPRYVLGLDALDVLIFGAAALLYLAVGAIEIHRLSLTGDEPWYVAQGYALLHFHSPDLAPIIKTPSLYQRFLEGTGAIYDHLRDYRGNGELLLPNLPGYGALVGLGYLLAGRWGIVAPQALCSAFTAALLSAEARRIYGSRVAGLFAALAFMSALPALLFTAQIFPSAFASTVAFGGYALAGRLPGLLGQGHPRRLGLTTAALAGAIMLLPWLHFKYALVALALLGILALRLLPWLHGRGDAAMRRGAWSALLAVAGATGLTFALVAVYCRHFFGTWSPQYSSASGGAMNFAHPDFGRLAALFSDMFLSQQSGLLPWVPLLLLAIPGLVVMWRRNVSRAVDLALCVAAQLAGFLTALFTTAVYQGYALPARFTVDCVPFFALAASGVVAAGVPASRQVWRRWWAAWRERGSVQPSTAGASALPPTSTPGMRHIPHRAGALGACCAVLLLVAGGWFSLVGLRYPELLYNTSAGNLIVERFTHYMPGWWFALFPDPEQVNPYIATMPLVIAGSAAAIGNTPMTSLAAEHLQYMPPGAYMATFSFTCTAPDAAASVPLTLSVEQVINGHSVSIAHTSLTAARCASGQVVTTTLPFRSVGYAPINFRAVYPLGMALGSPRVHSAPDAAS